MSFKDLCEVLFPSYEAENMISDEEFLLLYDEYSSKNPEFEPLQLKNVFICAVGCRAAKILPVGVCGTKNVWCL